MLFETLLLTEEEGSPVAVENAQGTSEVLLVCEHAGKKLPAALGALGLSDEALSSHIAWDPGALAVSRLMARTLDAMLIHQRYSRLVFDCNRPPGSEGAIRAVSETYEIPGNADLSEAEKAARAELLYHPFQNRIRDEIAHRKQRGQTTVLVTIHSFTPVYFGKPRAVEIGILHDADSRLADGMLAAAAGTSQFAVERNQPYGPADGVTHTLALHALPAGLLNVMIEIRNDLIADAAGQSVAADFLSGLLMESLKTSER
ncbi:N-formylglutamate amidohydrolase [Rhizobium sp. SSA_523]|uniref:N-formylglutamate amidohydrolase n=1 Tax=Rhizobium sp. SSA_523 TaxID=2952477 RepID=UPI002091E4C5|nr:N-formylglutamate amidohydrolase [Rhizobium sp. SSA_523]MCO5730336.1 N-formylglutamate amidohydrolase [Rhizobium sp. SSA_523]WKC25384.1 N-formylglutamate amidohydrolase [Rhizobium sp. SSA_523]